MSITVSEGAVQGVLHRAAEQRGAVVLTHGASGNCHSKLLVAMCDAFAGAGITSLRVDLAFRQLRPSGPPSPSGAQRDREGLREALGFLRGEYPVFLGGQSYGGRQASMLAAEDPAVCDGLLLLSYPLHPPGKPAQTRTDHFPAITPPVQFVHGSRDPFGSPEEMEAAVALVQTPHELRIIERAGHDLKPALARASEIVQGYLQFYSASRIRADQSAKSML